MEAITAALTEQLGTISTSMLSTIAEVVPKALPIVGAVLVVSIGVRAFKKIAK